MKTARPTGFLNVDLDIESSSALKCLADEMGSAIIVLHSEPMRDKHFLRLESARKAVTPDGAIRNLCRAVERLSAQSRSVWHRASRKEFNVGYDLRAGCRAVEVALLPETVKRIAALGASVGFTCYRDDDGQQNGRTESGESAPVPLRT